MKTCRAILIAHLALIVLILATDPAQGAPSPPYVFSSFSLAVDGEEILLDSVEFGTLIETASGSFGSVPGNFEWLPLTFTHTLQPNQPALLQWLQDMLNGSSFLRDFSVSGFDGSGAEMLRWDFTEAWITDTQTSFSTNQLGVETLSIVVRTMDWTVGLTSGANQAPSLSLPPSYSAPVGQITSFTVSASDPDGDIPTIINLQAPASATFSSGLFRWNVPLAALGTEQTISFQADDGQGAANSTTTNSLLLTIPIDFDGDLMDDDWEILWFGNLSATPGADSDNDTVSNLDEFWSATSPTNPASFFAIEQTATSNGIYQLNYRAQPGMEYQLESNEQLSNSTNWIRVGTIWLETNSITTLRGFNDPGSITNATRFYRLKVRRP